MDERTPALRRSYDRVAGEYAARLFGELEHKPLDRAMLDRFAELAGPLGPAADLGCGPGQVARYLQERGLSLVVGLDLSTFMIAEAKRRSPAIAYAVADMRALPLADGVLGGIAAFYSIIHVARAQQPALFAELRRALHPGGWLLLAFHLGEPAGASDVRAEELFGQPVTIDFLFFTRAEVETHLAAAGFAVVDSHDRPPYPGVEYQSRRGYILAQAPGATAREPD